ncbi:MAG: hypothetical protein ACKOHM_05375 [Spartobacteria bacterium]
MKKTLLQKPLVLSLLPLVFAAFSSVSAQAQEFAPEAHYGENWTPDDLLGDIKPAPVAKPVAATTPAASAPAKKGSGAEEDLRQWVTMGYLDPSGRPLPLTGNWMCDLPKPSKEPGESTLGWDLAYFIELIKQGHHVIPIFTDTSSVATRAYAVQDGAGKATEDKGDIDDLEAGDAANGKKKAKKGKQNPRKNADELLEKYRPLLEFCRDHKLPIAFRGWNYGHYPFNLQRIRSQMTGQPLTAENDPRLLVNGKDDGTNHPKMDPCGPVELWQEFGTFWFDNPLMRAVQEIYPDPPLVIFLDNNEGGKSALADPKSDRFLAKYGPGPHDQDFLRKVASEGYAERYQAMFDAARAACITPAWKNNIRFIAYNNLMPPHDGGMPEYYDNDWQPNKTDFAPDGLQSDAMNMWVTQAKVLKANPSFFWSSIFWDGGDYMAQIWRARGQGKTTPAKPFQYASEGQRWDFNRYEGVSQFGLWVMRPKLYLEFRGNPSRNAYLDAAWQRTLTIVDRPWSNPVLRDFWRFGTLVPNRFETPGRQPGKNWTEEQIKRWRADDRWFLLTCDANPPRGAWVPEADLRANTLAESVAPYEEGTDPWENATLRVFSVALVKGKEPNRSWLIYAHAPLGAVANTKVQLPGFGDAKLDCVPVSGSFFVVNESDRSVKTLIAGGPAEIAMSVKDKHVPSRSEVVVTAEVTCPPADALTGFVWSWGEDKEIKQDKLQPVKISFSKDGPHVVTVTGTTKSGQKLVGQQEVFVGPKPDKEILYDLPLTHILEWKGPWAWTGQQGETVTTYSQLPNAGTKARAIVAGGAIVTDPERGPVLEFTGDAMLGGTGLGGRASNEGVWLVADNDTVMDKKGAPNRTVSFRFKAADTQAKQVLYAEGSHVWGTNIHLSEGKLHAGSWCGKDTVANWITSGEVQPDKWYQVTLLLQDATGKLEDGKLSLYLDGVLVGKTAAARIPQSFVPPRLAANLIDAKKTPLTRFPEGKIPPGAFKGRLSDFKFQNKAEVPQASH